MFMTFKSSLISKNVFDIFLNCKYGLYTSKKEKDTIKNLAPRNEI